MRILLLFLLLITTDIQAAPYVYDYNGRCRDAYNAYLSLHLDDGTNLVRQEIQANPYNLMATFLADYDDCLLLLFNGDRKDFEQRRSHLDERLKLLNKGPQNTPWYRFCKAGVYLHWAMVYIRMGENLKAATTFRKFYILAKENQRLYPQFGQNKIILGLEETIAGTIPDEYQWLASIFGLKGSVTKGMAKLSGFVQSTGANEPLRAEAVIYQAYLKFYLLSKQDEVWRFVNSSAFPVSNNLFHAFVRTNLGLNHRQAAVALQTLKTAQADPDYNSFPIFDFEMGSALQQQLSTDAPTYFLRFINRSRGRFFIKEAWQRIALNYYLQGNTGKAREALAKVKTQGTAQTDADKGAVRFANAGTFPNAVILQSRLLFDGGYYNESLKKLGSLKPDALGNMSDKLEYYFRYGRIYDETGNDAKAVQFYRQTISLGRDRQEYFAARAALQMGMMMEKMGRKAEAIAAYEECLSMKRHDFQANIDQQAKAGINRLTL